MSREVTSTAPAAGPGEPTGDGHRPRRRAVVILGGAVFLLLSQAFVPMDEFVHRGDDTFYYFEVAANFRDHGFWTFDTINGTNGVQPIWAVILTAVAVVAGWAGVDDPGLLARVFVGLTALVHFASGMVLFYVLVRKVSLAAAVAAAGAFLFPMGLVWAHVWGLENSLYALTLLSTVALFHLWFLPRPSVLRAAGLGAALGLTALSRLNAGVFVACVLLFYVARRAHGPAAQRVRLGVLAGAVAAAFVVPYLAWNLATTDSLLPISGAVKEVESERWLAHRQIESRLSPEFISEVVKAGRAPLSGFLESRATDGLWLVGGRVVFEDAPRMGYVVGLVLAVALLPALLAPGQGWFRHLAGRLTRLGAFAYVSVFALVDAGLALFLFPDEMNYALVRWWLVASEIVIIVVVATVVGEAVAHVAAHRVPSRHRLTLATAGLAALVLVHAGQSLSFYWDGEVQHPSWNKSWNDEALLAARWVDANLPEDAVVGSWNAGVLGYYAERRVVNLDGLINGFELLPYLREERIGDYIAEEGIQYLSDLEPMFTVKGAELASLTLTEVYRHHSEFARRDYVIYRVDAAPAT